MNAHGGRAARVGWRRVITAVAGLLALACTTEPTLIPVDITSLTITPGADTVVIGDSTQLHAVGTNTRGVPFLQPGAVWETSDAAVATVSSGGTVTAVSEGAATITATLLGFTATANVFVTPRPLFATSADSVGFTAAVGAAVPAAQTIDITNAGGGTIAGINVDSIVYSGAVTGWLNAVLSTNAAPDVLTLQPNTSALALGTHVATVWVSAPGVDNGPLQFNATYTVTVGAPATIALESGNGQTAQAGAAVAIDPAVIVRDAFSNPVPGVSVTFAVVGGGGSVNPAGVSVTGVDGIARVVSWTLGTVAGTNTLTATAGALGGSPVTFTATGVPGPAAQIAKVTGDGQSAQVGSAVQIAPSVRVTDAFGNFVSGTVVTFAIASGAGSATGTSQTSDASGLATVGSWTLGTSAGSNTLTATAPGLAGSPLTFTATGTVGPGTPVSAAQSSVSAGTASITACSASCSAGSTASLITVTVRDQFANPIQGASVTISASGSSNSFAPAASGTTNASGVFTATMSSTLAQGKTLSAVANAVSITQTAAVTVNAAAVSLTNSLISAATSSITACAASCVNGTTASLVTVTIRDAFSNPISGQAVTPSCSAGSSCVFNAANGTTNASGVFQSSFTSTLAQAKTLRATVTGPGLITPTAAVTVVAAAPSSVTVTNHGLSARVGTNVSTRPTYTVLDAFSNAVSGQAVSVTTVGGGGTVSPLNGTTNASGQFTPTSWTMGSANADDALGRMANTATLTAGSVTGTATDYGIYTWSGDAINQLGSPSTCGSCHGSAIGPSLVGTVSSCAGIIQIVAGNASNSFVYQVLLSSFGGCGVNQMPRSLPPYNAAQLKIIRAWINNGAQNN